jgi:soluble P-type ATPase
LGNGSNDMKMLEASGLGIAVIGREGAAISAINNADITVCSVVDGLDLLLKPDRIKATLRVA